MPIKRLKPERPDLTQMASDRPGAVQLTGERADPVYGYEVSDKLSALAEEYRSDNLPITFRDKKPNDEFSANADSRMFVEQLRAIGISSTRIQNAIIDYYRAFEQRSSWARESLLISDEMANYEDRLADEWGRYKELVFENIETRHHSDEALDELGRSLYRWAEFDTGHIRIRERVTEPYVVRGGFHILANARPSPRVYWHPRFMERLSARVEETA